MTSVSIIRARLSTKSESSTRNDSELPLPTRSAEYQFYQGKGNGDHVLPLIDSLRSSSRLYLALGPKLGADVSDLKPLRAFAMYVSVPICFLLIFSIEGNRHRQCRFSRPLLPLVPFPPDALSNIRQGRRKRSRRPLLHLYQRFVDSMNFYSACYSRRLPNKTTGLS